MAVTGKITTFFSDKAKTKPIFPFTKTKTVSDENGVGLDAILEETKNNLSSCAKSSQLGTQINYSLSGNTLTITTK